jgi:hypothetical protein
VQTTFNANNNDFSATARALANNTSVEVSAGFVANWIKQMEVRKALQRLGAKYEFLKPEKTDQVSDLQKKSFAKGLESTSIGRLPLNRTSFVIFCTLTVDR